MYAVPQSYIKKVRHKYNGPDEIWLASDRWHSWTRRQIKAEMAIVSKEFSNENSAMGTILDVGSGGYAYFHTDCRRIDVDIAEARLSNCSLGICANVTNLPLQSEISDLTICVGSVVNYCSLEEAIYELTRTTKRNGRLVLHVELSNSWEFFGTKAYRADAAFVTTFYKGVEQYWVYSNEYVRRTLLQNGMTIERAKYFHLVSSLVYRITHHPNLSSYFAIADRLFGWIRVIDCLSDSVIFVCRRLNV
jgi:hypothetical protein